MKSTVIVCVYLIISSTLYAQKHTELRNEIVINLISHKSDSLSLVIYPHFYNISYVNGNANIPFTKFKGQKKGLDRIQFIIPNINKPCYFSITSKKGESKIGKLKLPELFLLEPNDRINATVDSLTIENKKRFYFNFTGPNSAKYNCQRLLDSIFLWDQSKRLTLLKSYQTRISPLIYNILKADILGSSEISNLRLLNSHVEHNTVSKDSALLYLKTKTDDFSQEEIETSKFYPYYIVSRSMFIDKYENKDRLATYSYLKTHYHGQLRDKLITAFITDEREVLTDATLIDAMTEVKNSFYKNILGDFINPILKGSKVYDFSLPDSKGNIIHLSDFKGKVVFIDFWFTGCTACSGYYHDVVSTVEEQFRDNNKVVFVSISIDKNKYTWLNSISSTGFFNGEGHEVKSISGRYTSKDVINLYTGGEGENNIVIKKYKIESFPSPMIIDKEGKIFSINKAILRGGGPIKLAEEITKAIQN